MSDKPDWEAIRREYEAGGITLRPLALKYGVSKTTLIERRNKEEWVRPTDRPTDQTGHLHLVRSELPSTPSAVDGANLGIQALVVFLQKNAKAMTLIEHVKAAAALYQYNRIIVNAAPEEEEDNLDLITIDTRDLSAEELARLKAFALEMKEQQAG